MLAPEAIEVSIHTRHHWRVNLYRVDTPARSIVSIHTRHHWRVNPLGQRFQTGNASVSIHTRHHWRVNPGIFG